VTLYLRDDWKERLSKAAEALKIYVEGEYAKR
jgi:hypothetical protein